MPKGVYLRKPKPKKVYPADLVEAVRSRYWTHRMSQEEICTDLGLTLKVVQRLMGNHGIPRRPKIKRDQRGEKNAIWRGSGAKYQALHIRVIVARGRPSECSRCGRTDDGTRYEWANLSGRYDDVNDYARMCASCHHRFDGTVRNLGAYAVRKEVSHP